MVKVLVSVGVFISHMISLGHHLAVTVFETFFYN